MIQAVDKGSVVSYNSRMTPIINPDHPDTGTTSRRKGTTINTYNNFECHGGDLAYCQICHDVTTVLDEYNDNGDTMLACGHDAVSADAIFEGD